MSDGPEKDAVASSGSENSAAQEMNAAAPDTGTEENMASAENGGSINEFFRRMMDCNFLDYARYVIKDRAIPDVDDGLKPVQRRILWALSKVYNGQTHKVARIVGNTMHYHPHGDASINDALVVLANKGGCVVSVSRDKKTGEEKTEYFSTPYYIEKQGNFGNILTGSPAAAGRYIECALTEMAYETMFNDDITELVPNYDGTEMEPVVLPSKLPTLLMLGSEGIAVGMATQIMPHNFNELIDAEIAILHNDDFQLFPDFQQGGLMDVREYADGAGKIVLRAKIKIVGRDLIITEIPAFCTSESLVESIKRAAEKNKIKISSVDDYTTDHVEIKVTPTRGYDPEKTMQALYMYTDCSLSKSVNMTVIRDSRPVQMTVSEVLRRNVDKLLEYFKRELEIDLERQNELHHAKTLAQIFFENRIYKRIEECKTQEAEYDEVMSGLAPFRHLLKRDVTTEDVDKLLALPVRRIARFDIEKNQRELAEIKEKIKEIRRHLGALTEYAVNYLLKIKERYGANFPRRTEIENFRQIDRKAAALNNVRIGHDRKTGYIGTAVKCDEPIVCNEFDHLLMVEKNGHYKVTDLPGNKLFVGKLYECRKYDPATEFGVIYRDQKTGKYYGKRSRIGSFIKDRDYMLCPPGCKLELLTPRADAVYQLVSKGAKKSSTEELNLQTLPLRAPKARGVLVSSVLLGKITWLRFLTAEELQALRDAAEVPDTGADEETAEAVEAMEAAAVAVEAEAAVNAVTPEIAEETEAEIPAEPESEAVPEAETPSAPEAVPEEIFEPADLPGADDVPPEKPKRTRAKKPAPEIAETKEVAEKVIPDEAPEAVTEKEPETVPEKSAESPKIIPLDDDNDLGIVQPEFGF